jgi:hypothetical protein
VKRNFLNKLSLDEHMQKCPLCRGICECNKCDVGSRHPEAEEQQQQKKDWGVAVRDAENPLLARRPQKRKQHSENEHVQVSKDSREMQAAGGVGVDGRGATRRCPARAGRPVFKAEQRQQPERPRRLSLATVDYAEKDMSDVDDGIDATDSVQKAERSSSLAAAAAASTGGSRGAGGQKGDGMGGKRRRRGTQQDLESGEGGPAPKKRRGQQHQLEGVEGRGNAERQQQSVCAKPETDGEMEEPGVEEAVGSADQQGVVKGEEKKRRGRPPRKQLPDKQDGLEGIEGREGHQKQHHDQQQLQKNGEGEGQQKQQLQKKGWGQQHEQEVVRQGQGEVDCAASPGARRSGRERKPAQKYADEITSDDGLDEEEGAGEDEGVGKAKGRVKGHKEGHGAGGGADHQGDSGRHKPAAPARRGAPAVQHRAVAAGASTGAAADACSGGGGAKGGALPSRAIAAAPGAGSSGGGSSSGNSGDSGKGVEWELPAPHRGPGTTWVNTKDKNVRKEVKLEDYKEGDWVGPHARLYQGVWPNPSEEPVSVNADAVRVAIVAQQVAACADWQ